MIIRATGNKDVHAVRLSDPHVLMVTIHVEQDEDGMWCASATVAPGVAAFGEGATEDEALADMHEGLKLLRESLDDA